MQKGYKLNCIPLNKINDITFFKSFIKISTNQNKTGPFSLELNLSDISPWEYRHRANASLGFRVLKSAFKRSMALYR